MKKVYSGISGSGIYLIISPTNKIYIGQSWNLHNRFLDYRRKLCKKQAKLNASLNKYGFEAHKFEVILQLSESVSQKIIDYWEQFFIDYFRNEGYELMNIREGGSRGKLSKETIEKLRVINTGRKFSLETLLKRSKASKGENNPRFGVLGVNNCLSKPVNQYSKDGIFIKKWDSVSDIEREIKIDSSSIIKNIQGKRFSAGNYTWKYCK